MADPPQNVTEVIAWAPFYDRGKFQYWVDTGRGTITIGSDGKPRVQFYNDRHAHGGSKWTHLLPVGEQPTEPVEEKPPEPKRHG